MGVLQVASSIVTLHYVVCGTGEIERYAGSLIRMPNRCVLEERVITGEKETSDLAELLSMCAMMLVCRMAVVYQRMPSILCVANIAVKCY